MVKYQETRECGEFIEVVYRIRKETALVYSRVHKCIEQNSGYIEIDDCTVYDEIRDQIVDEDRIVCDSYGKNFKEIKKKLKAMSDNRILEEEISLDEIETRANEIMDIVCPVLIICKNKPTIFYFLDKDLYIIIEELLEYLSENYKKSFIQLCKLSMISFRQSMNSKILLSLFLNMEIEAKKIVKTYLMKDKTGLYKIGRSTDPYRRTKDLRVGNSAVELVCEINDDIEKELHEKYSQQRVTGEWFNLTAKQAEEIVKLSKRRCNK